MTPAAQGVGRVRFMAVSPDGRVFAPDMINLDDNNNGILYVLDGFDEASGGFRSATKYLTGLRNPNSVAFYTDTAGRAWLYLALTDRLVRYAYRAGDSAPTSAPQVIARFPDYGLDYKHGGWHLTRTVAIHNHLVYVSVGSSCNACEERADEVRAAIVVMQPDGTGQRVYAAGLRNAVGMRFSGAQLLATNMGADHLGADLPNETLLRIVDGGNYGWPYCFSSGSTSVVDGGFAASRKVIDCRSVPAPLAVFPAHSAPLGLERFDGGPLAGRTLVALHGSSDISLRRGYSVVGVDASGSVETMIDGFLEGTTVYGRPADIVRFAKGFLMSDDKAGVVYYVRLPG